MGLAQLGLTITLTLSVVWWRAGWVYAFEAGRDELLIETRGRIFNRERRGLREHVERIRLVIDRRDRAQAMEIKSSNPLLRGMWLAGIGDEHVRAAAAAIGEGMGMDVS
jgi:hypothetical protein